MRGAFASPLFATFGIVLLGALGCGQQNFTSHLSHYCSVDPDEDPHYTCAKGADLVCINTYSINVERDAGVTTMRPIYLCRLACSPEAPCREGGDVCCPGMIYGRTYGKTHACVPSEFCQTIDAAPRREAARPPPPSDASTDASADAGAGGSADRPSTETAANDSGAPGAQPDARAQSDVPVDAPAVDGGGDAGGVDAPMTFDGASGG